MKKLAALAVLALAALALAACGSSSEESSSTEATSQESTAEADGASQRSGGEGSGGGGSTVAFETDPQGNLAYTTTETTAKAGKVTIEFNNPQSLTHDVVIENSHGEEVAATELIADGSDSTTANLKPGTYTYYCSVPGHRDAGMEGTLVVK